MQSDFGRTILSGRNRIKMSTITTFRAKSTKIEFVVNEASKITSNGIFSPTFTLHNLNWCIRIAKCPIIGSIRAYLACRHSNLSPWSCTAKAKFKLVIPSFNTGEVVPAYEQDCTVNRNSIINNSSTAAWWDIIFRRMNFNDDKFTLECEITVDPPKCAFWKHIMDSNLVVVDANEKNCFINALAQIFLYCNYLNGTESVYSVVSNISFKDWAKNLFDSINSRKMKQIFLAFRCAATDELKVNSTELLKIFFETIKAKSSMFPILCEGLQRIYYVQPSDGYRFVVESKVFYSIPIVSGNVYKSLDAFKIVRDGLNIAGNEGGHKEAIIDVLPQYLIFTIERNQQQELVEFTEEIELANYASFIPRTKYTLCALVITTEVQPYFSLAKCVHINKWIAYDSNHAFECSEEDVVKHVESDAVLLVYKLSINRAFKRDRSH